MADTLVQREGVTPSPLREVLVAIQRARRGGADDDREWKATALKAQGLAYEALGEQRSLLRCTRRH
jgi:hypothetical protein